ncbi:Dystrophin [Anas platyrhynchos]|uniref:Dystrophin n=1 Tax=Anas platyrhynchos TaxID=8839 RepID=R0LCR1_ANAPL|nr:Dystrophin [Anas platyrhynchos]
MGSGPGSWSGPSRPVDTQGALALFWGSCCSLKSYFAVGTLSSRDFSFVFPSYRRKGNKVSVEILRHELLLHLDVLWLDAALLGSPKPVARRFDKSFEKWRLFHCDMKSFNHWLTETEEKLSRAQIESGDVGHAKTNQFLQRGEFRSGFFREPPVHTKLADVPFSIPAALSLHTRNGKALCGCTAGCAELKSSGGNLAGFGQPFKEPYRESSESLNLIAASSIELKTPLLSSFMRTSRFDAKEV